MTNRPSRGLSPAFWSESPAAHLHSGDAIAGGIAAALNDYLDLLAGVLILWYGGGIAASPHGSITVGKLITYQLCASRTSNLARALLDPFSKRL